MGRLLPTTFITSSRKAATHMAVPLLMPAKYVRAVMERHSTVVIALTSGGGASWPRLMPRLVTIPKYSWVAW